ASIRLEPVPEALALFALSDAGAHRASAILQDDLCLGPGAEVQPPGRLARAPAVHRERDQPGAILVVAEDHRALLARATPDGRQAHHSGQARLRQPQATPAARESVDASMYDPGESDEPARRQLRPGQGRPFR